jgi:hypothetical protein
VHRGSLFGARIHELPFVYHRKISEPVPLSTVCETIRTKSGYARNHSELSMIDAFWYAA